jgi:hypothetical protein
MRNGEQYERVPSLILGFNGAILQRLRHALNVKMVISEDQSADISWRTLQYLDIDPIPQIFSEQLLECLAFAKRYYLRFSDIYSRRYPYVADPPSEIQNAFIVIFYICYDILEKNDIELIVFSNIPHEGYDYIFYLIALHQNLKIVMCYQSLIPNRFFICSDIHKFGNFSENAKISDLESISYTLPSSWFYMDGAGKDQSYKLSQMIWELLKNPRGIRVALLKHYYASRYRKNVRASTSRPIDGEKYVYFPLHLQPELTTSALGGEYADQLTALEILSHLVPTDYWVYVKDNPKQTEIQRGPLFFKRLNNLKNVRLIDRSMNSIALTKGSEAVAVVTGTAGWEALFHGKPVLVFGQAWYTEFRGVTKYTGGLSFDIILQNGPDTNYATVETLNELMTKTGIGVVDVEYLKLISPFDEVSNANAVCRSICAYLNAMPYRT